MRTPLIWLIGMCIGALPGSALADLVDLHVQLSTLAPAPILSIDEAGATIDIRLTFDDRPSFEGNGFGILDASAVSSVGDLDFADSSMVDRAATGFDLDVVTATQAGFFHGGSLFDDRLHFIVHFPGDAERLDTTLFFVLSSSRPLVLSTDPLLIDPQAALARGLQPRFGV